MRAAQKDAEAYTEIARKQAVFAWHLHRSKERPWVTVPNFGLWDWEHMGF